jgi:hypothetical protein
MPPSSHALSDAERGITVEPVQGRTMAGAVATQSEPCTLSSKAEQRRNDHCFDGVALKEVDVRLVSPQPCLRP